MKINSKTEQIETFSFVPSTGQLRIYLVLIAFFTLSIGMYSRWLFDLIYPVEDYDPWYQGFFQSGFYSSQYIFWFHIAWTLLHRNFPLQKSSNAIYHVIGQIFIAAFSYSTAGLFVEAVLADVVFPEHVQQLKNKEHLEIGVITLFMVIGTIGTIATMYFREFIGRALKAEKKQVESELSALRAQINPHFLFNSLNSIAALVRIHPEKAESVTEDLSDVFRYTLRASQKPLVSLKEEMEIIGLYLNIEMARFGDRLTVNINVPDELAHIQVPSLVLQPLVENAIKHGVSKVDGKHSINIYATRRSIEPVFEACRPKTLTFATSTRRFTRCKSDMPSEANAASR